MADTRPWLKLWKSAYSDPGLTQLSLEDQARWFRLLLYVGLNGEDGSVLVRQHARGLLTVFWTTSQPRGSNVIARTPKILDRMPGVVWADEHAGLRVTFTKWAKYQEDTSADRTKQWRNRRQPSDMKDVSRDTSPDRHTEPRGDGARSRSRRDSPHSPPETPTKGQGRAPGEDPRSPTGAFPPECFRTDCPDKAWHGRCVDQAYAAAHPGAYPVQLSTGLAKQCPAHRPAGPTTAVATTWP
jgi:hypothetical protein